MKTVYYSLPLFGHQFMATINGAGALNRLSIAGRQDGDQYGYSEAEINATAYKVAHRLPVIHAPIDLTNY